MTHGLAASVALTAAHGDGSGAERLRTPDCSQLSATRSLGRRVRWSVRRARLISARAPRSPASFSRASSYSVRSLPSLHCPPFPLMTVSRSGSVMSHSNLSGKQVGDGASGARSVQCERVVASFIAPTVDGMGARRRPEARSESDHATASPGTPSPAGRGSTRRSRWSMISRWNRGHWHLLGTFVRRAAR